MNKSSVIVWVGDYGDYKVPDNLLTDVRLTKRGWPDKRNPAKYNKVMGWVDAQEKNARERNERGESYA